MRPIGKRAIPDLQTGPARIVVHASRPVVYGIREAETSITRDVQVRLEPPRVAVLSTFHYVNLGGSEFVVYRATPGGRRVGRARRRQGVPRATRRSGAGIQPRSGAARRVLRAALRSGPSTRRSASSPATSPAMRSSSPARSHGVPEGLSEEPDRDRRPLPAARRAGDRRQLAGREDRRPTTCSRAS